MFCVDFIQTTWFIFSPETPALLYYSHIPTAFIAIIFGFFIFLNEKKNLANQIFFTLNLFYSLLVFFNLILWTNSYIPTLVFIWPITQILFIIIPVLALYFFYVFINKKDVAFLYKIFWFVVILIPTIIAYTKLNIIVFNPSSCELETSNLLFIYQNVVFGLIFICLVGLFIKKILSKLLQINERKILIYLFIGILMFLIFFTVAWQLAEFYDYFSFEQYGLFGMTAFLAVTSFLIVKFKAFEIKLIATQVLVWVLIFLIGSQFFFIKTPINFILNGITFIGVIVAGSFLIKSVKKEIEQREHLEKLSKLLKESKDRIEETNIKLENANEKLKGLDKLKTEFLSLASHQLRSPLTAIKGYTSMLLDGDFGKVTAKQKEAINRVFQSSNHLALTVEDLLNVAKIEQGGMVYTKVDFDLEKVVGDITKDLSVTAEKKGLKLTFETDKKSPYNINGDLEKIRQVVLNFIDNSMKYTPKGSITVKLIKDENAKKIIFAVSDTGMGIKPEIKDTLFNKFARGEGGKLNTSGSGLGLYLAKEIVEAHGGRVWAESEGENMGSTFSVELNSI